MGLYQRRRPPPILIPPTRVRRQEDGEQSSTSSDGSDSPQSPDSPNSPDSPESSESPSSTQSSFSSSLQPPPTQTAVPSQVSSQTSTPAQTTQTSIGPLPPPPPPLPPSISQEETTTSSRSQTPTAQERASSEVPAPSAPPALPVASTPAQGRNSTVTSQSRVLGTATPVLSTTDSASSALVRRPVFSPTSSPPSPTETPLPINEIRSSTTGTAFVPAQSELEGENSGIGRESYRYGDHHERPILTKGAEAAAITLSILGFIALIAGIFVFFKRRKRRHHESSMRHAEDAFNPGNSGSLNAPETAHIGDGYGRPPPSLAHMTKFSTNSSTLFGGSYYQRPETVSTNSNPSRMRAAPSVIPPQPTPNPFADPPRNKAYDQLRGRPRSTTLTDRGSWIKNPFKDPTSERFDPFGELQEKARAERRKYVEEARREAEEMRRKEEEQEYLEKERMGLTVPRRDERKGSDVTIGGIGVLDRSGDGMYR